MVHLVLKATAEPIDEPVGGNVSGSGDLKLPEVGSLVSGIDGHAIVTKSKDSGEEEAAAGLGDDEVSDSSEQGHVVEHSKQPGVVKDEGHFLQHRELHLLLVNVGVLD